MATNLIDLTGSKSVSCHFYFDQSTQHEHVAKEAKQAVQAKVSADRKPEHVRPNQPTRKKQRGRIIRPTKMTIAKLPKHQISEKMQEVPRGKICDYTSFFFLVIFLQEQAVTRNKLYIVYQKLGIWMFSSPLIPSYFVIPSVFEIIETD